MRHGPRDAPDDVDLEGSGADGHDAPTTISRARRRHVTTGARAQLTIDVVDVRPADDRDVHAPTAQLLVQVTDLRGVAAAVGHRRAVPVEHDRLEAVTGLRL